MRHRLVRRVSATIAVLLVSTMVVRLNWSRLTVPLAITRSRPIAVTTVAVAQPASIAPIDELEHAVLELTNRERLNARLPPLARDAALSAAARAHSADMLRRDFFDHVNPDRQTPADRVRHASGSPARAMGENIWMWSGAITPPLRTLADRSVGDWMASAPHRANVLNPRDTRIGVGAEISPTNVRLTVVFSE